MGRAVHDWLVERHFLLQRKVYGRSPVMAEGPRIFKKESDLTSATLRVTRTMLVPAIKTFPAFTLLSVPL